MTYQEHLLSILAKECIEVSEHAIKSMHFGLAETHPEQPVANAERIRQEFSDVCAIYELIGLNFPSRLEIESKKDKIARFLQRSREEGYLVED